MKQFSSEVLSNRQVGADLYDISFGWDADVEDPVPGQFLTIKNSVSTDPLLRRPFAVASFDASARTASIVYQLRGKATRELAAKRKGERLDVLGPLGNHFPEPKDGAECLLVAGGIGVGPIVYFAKRLAEWMPAVFATLIIGARTEALLPQISIPAGPTYVACTDDGSTGERGTAVDALCERLDRGKGRSRVVYACGPDAMLRTCSKECESRDLECWVSMEQVMGCAVGACMGCAIRVKGPAGYARVCTEGPVFNSRELLWS